jgi:hypothetical protein
MLSKRVLIPAAIAAAVGIPILNSTEFGGSMSERNDAAARFADFDPMAPEGQPELSYLPIQNFAEILRFDIDARWVVGRWPRVSTAPGVAGLQGMRVALVTGGNPWDVCGAMTYFFDSQQRLQRIQITGVTGDPQPLIQTLVQQFGFQGHTTTAAGLYTARRGQEVIGLLRLDHAAVLDANEPNQRYALLLEINRLDGGFALSTSTAALATAQPY